MPSLLAGAPFVQTTLTARVPVSGQWETDANGNDAPKTTQITLKALFAPYRFDQLRFRPGADPKIVAGRGELIDPLTFPSGVGVGSRLSLTWAGQTGELLITNIIPNDLAGIEFGTYFAGDIRFV